jgi:putative phosphoesterase
MTIIGVIADTHGLLRPSALAALAGSDAIVHAGDIGDPVVLDGLRAIAPVTAVRGNVDLQWARDLPDRATLALEARRILVLHDLKDLAIDTGHARFDVVVSGHSHVPKVEWREAVLYVNPGSAGRRRFRLPVAVARIELRPQSIEAHILELEH